MATRNFKVKNGLEVGLATISASTGNLSTVNADLGNLAVANYFEGDGSKLEALAGGNVSGQVANALVSGTVYTAAQPAITSVGTLTGLTVSGITATGSLRTDNLQYANGTAWDLQEPAGSNTQVQYNNGGDFGAKSTFTFDSASDRLTIGGNINAGNVVATGLVQGGTLAGSLTTASQPNVTSLGTLSGLTVTNPIVGSVTGTASTITTAAQPNITSVGTLSSLDVTGNVDTSANLVTDRIIGKSSGISVTAIGTDQDITLIPTGTGATSVSSKRIKDLATPTASTDAATKQYVDDVAQGLAVHAPCDVATTGTLTSITGGTITYDNGTAGVGATLTTSSGNFDTIDGYSVQTNDRVLVKDEATGANNGIYVKTSSTVLTRADDFDTPTEMAGGDFTFVSNGTSFNDCGFVMTDPVATVGTSDVTFVQFSGAGTYTAGAGLTLTGSEFKITDTAVTAGSYGNGTHNATFTVDQRGQLTAAANVAITANAETLVGTELKSTVTDSSLTSVGTLGSLSVTANVGAGNVNATGGVFTYVSGDGANLSSIAGGNVTGTVATATTAGTVTTAAQPNITSVGTLSALTVTGITATGSLRTDNLQYANGSAWDLQQPGGSNTQVQFNNQDQFGGSANFTFDTADSNLDVDGNVTVSTGKFYGDGGGLSAIAGANVTGEVTNAATANAVAGANVSGEVSFAATANAVAGANVSGTVSSATTATTAGTVTTAAQPNITSVGTLTSVTTSGAVDAVSFGTNRSNVAVSTNTVVDEFDPSDYRTAKYVVSGSGDDGYQSAEVLMVHDGTDAFITVYGTICSNTSADLVEFSSNINGVSGNCTLYATTGSNNTKVNMVVDYILT